MWVSGGIHPHWREVLRTFAAGTGHDLVDVPLVDGRTDWASVQGGAARQPSALLVSSPNYLGVIEDLAAARAAADDADALLLVGFDPVSSGLLRPPGEYGADVVVGEGQPFGTPLSFGGPYLGLFSCRMEHVRRLPGRLVGRTVDNEGRPTLRHNSAGTRAGHTPQKASSNVCTNQTLIAVACMIQLSWLGASGLREMALRSAQGGALRPGALSSTSPECRRPSAGPTLREFALRTPVPADTVVERMADEGFLAGVAVGVEGGVVSDGGDLLLVALTERRTAPRSTAMCHLSRRC